MAPDWRQLLRWLKSGRQAVDALDKKAPSVHSSGSTMMSPEGTPTVDEPPAASSAATSEMPSASKSPVASTPGSRQASPGATAKPPVNRNGIPVLRPGDDLERLLQAMEETGPQEDPTAVEAPPPVVSPRGRKKRDISTAKASHRGKPRYNRHGLPLLSDQDDLQDRFKAAGTNDPSPDEHSSEHPSRCDDGYPRDKHGIPRLDHCHDLGRLLEAASGGRDSDEDLVDAFERSIAHDAHTLIKKKTGGHFPTRKLTLKERLKRYPKPQGQLDLHGLTAVQAEQRTDTYIRTAHADGLFTLRIIVGKGLHSESGAVLPDVVEDGLNRLKRDGLVVTYRWDKGVKRKSGAVIVYLEAPF